MADDNIETLGDLGLESVADSLRSAMLPEGGAGDAEPLDNAPTTDAVSLERVQNRADDGKYAEGFREHQPADDPAAEPAAESATPPATEPAELEPLEPPTDWTLEDQQAFRAMPPEHQKFVMGRLENIPKADPDVEQIVAARKDDWARLGQTPGAALNGLLAISDYANDNPLEFIQWFAQNRGIDLKQFGASDTSGQQPATPAADDSLADDPAMQDPVVKAIMSQINKVVERQEATEKLLTSQRDQAAQVERAQANSRLQQFAEATNEDGSLKHPYFKEVGGLMSAALDQSLGEARAKNLEEAYEMACRAHPQVYAKINAAQEAAAERERKKKEREKAAAAKTAGASVSGDAAGAPSRPAPTGDVRDDLRAEFAARGIINDSAMI